MLDAVHSDLRSNPTIPTVVLAATASGKSDVEVRLAWDFYQKTGHPALILTEKDYAANQLAAHCRNYDPAVGVEHAKASSASPNSWVIVSTFSALMSPGRAHRIERIQPKRSIIVNDEAHHAAAPGHMRVLDRFGRWKIPHVGFTGTFDRSYDPQALIQAFPRVSWAKHLLDFMKHGYVVDLIPHTVRTGVSISHVPVKNDYDDAAIAQAIDVRERNAMALGIWKKELEPAGRNAIIFAANVQHVDHLTEMFRSADVNAKPLVQTISAKEREKTLTDFKSGEVPVLIAYSIPLESLDAWVTDIFHLRPTTLQHLVEQMWGRALRPDPQVASALGHANSDEARHTLLEASGKPAAHVWEFLDQDKRERAGAATMLGLRSDFEFDDGSTLRQLAQTQTLLALVGDPTVMGGSPGERLREVRVRKASELNRRALTPTQVVISMTLHAKQRQETLPPQMRNDAAQGALDWHVIGPNRWRGSWFALQDNELQPRFAVLTSMGAIWTAQTIEKDGRERVLHASPSFSSLVDFVRNLAVKDDHEQAWKIVKTRSSNTSIREQVQTKLLDLGINPATLDLLDSNSDITSYDHLRNIQAMVATSREYVQAFGELVEQEWNARGEKTFSRSIVQKALEEPLRLGKMLVLEGHEGVHTPDRCIIKPQRMTTAVQSPRGVR
jgi:superfamily II DNA or RNA helicase